MHLVLSGNVKAISTAVFDNFMLLPKYAYLIILCTLTFVINIRKKKQIFKFYHYDNKDYNKQLTNITIQQNDN